MEAIIKKKILPIVVKGFTILPLFSQDFGFFSVYCHSYYWDAKEGQAESLLGPLLAQAAKE
jgi:hypothetical protein